MRKAGISMVALVITIIVLIVLTSAVVITGIGVPKQAQLAVFYSNIDTVQDLVSITMGNNMILNGFGDNYKWQGIVAEPVVFEQMIEGLDKNVARILGTLLEKTSLPPEERSKYYVDNNGVVYYEGFVYEGQTLYTKGTVIGNNTTPVVVNPTDGSYNPAKGVNSPKLMTGMTAVYWDANGNEITSNNTNFEYNNWYDYVAQTGTTENGGTSHWANAKTEDGSYWVWIPRYAYCITSGYHTSTAGEIEIEFLKGTATTSSEENRIFANASGQGNWNIHPAFSFEETELTGIWVAKYEMSMETRATSEEEWAYKNTGSATDGNKVIDNTTKETIRAVSKPGVSSWRYITIGNSFTNGLAYNTTYESHLIKNSEWGAVAYLTQSIYGRNGTEVTMSDNSDYYTGGINEATALTNVLQSTTGNEYGIYDMAGGAWDWAAVYLSGTTNSNGAALINGDAKYKDIYPSYSATTYGDAVYETSSSTSSFSGSWHADCSCIVFSNYAFFLRSGMYVHGSVAGLFAFNCANGGTFEETSWRIVLW